MTARTPFTLTVRTPTVTGTDPFGNPITQWVERSWKASAIAPGAQQGLDPSDVRNRDLSIVAYTIYGVPENAPASHLDEVLLPGDTEWLLVEGEPRDWTRGPFGKHPTAGVTVELRRAEG